MTTPQPGIFDGQPLFHHALEYAVAESDDTAALRSALGALRTALAVADVQSVIAFGSALWSRLAPSQTPANLRPFAAMPGVAATQRDLLIWIHGISHDEVLETALAADRIISPVASPALDVAGFRFKDSRDLTGFIDGTANPKDDDRLAEALIPDGRPGAGGSFMLTQKWRHDLASFDALPVADQERVVGRTKPDSVELTGDAMPATSHVSRTDVKLDGVAQKLYRRSFPYGDVSENGLYFLAFACDPGRFEIQLRRMYGLTDDGLVDALTGFSTPLSSSYWFAPSLESLDAALG